MKRARVKYDEKATDRVHVYLDTVHYGAALQVVTHAQANPPQGYKWRRMTIMLVKQSTKKCRVTATWEYLQDSKIMPLSADEMRRSEMVKRLERLAEPIAEPQLRPLVPVDQYFVLTNPLDNKPYRVAAGDLDAFANCGWPFVARPPLADLRHWSLIRLTAPE